MSRIHRELEYCFRCIQNLIQLEKKLRGKIREINIFGNKTPRWIHGIKNHSIWIGIRGEIKEQSQESKFDCEEREID